MADRERGHLTDPDPDRRSDKIEVVCVRPRRPPPCCGAAAYTGQREHTQTIQCKQIKRLLPCFASPVPGPLPIPIHARSCGIYADGVLLKK